MEVALHIRRKILARTARRSALPATLLALLLAAAVQAPARAQTEAAGGETRLLRVATSGDYAPFSFTVAAGADNAEGLDGFDVEVARRFARERGYRLELHRFRWPELSRELAAGSFDVAMSGVTVRAERAVSGRYSIPVARSQAIALSWKGSGADTLANLDKPLRRIAVNAGGHLEAVADKSFRRAQVIPLADNDAVRMAFLDRAFDAVVTDNFEAEVWSAGVRDVARVGPFSEDRKAYLLPADRAELATELDAWLLEREKDGSLAALRKRWFAAGTDGGAAAMQETARPAEALAAAIAERLSLMPFVYEAKKRAQKPIEDKEQEAAVLEAALRSVEQAAAGRTAPDAAATRRLLELLMQAGKDIQQELADREAKQRPGLVKDRSSGSEVVVPGGNTPPAVEPQRKAGTAKRSYDLGQERRPALGRITDRIARLLVVLEPVSGSEVRRRFREALVPSGLSHERIDELADAVVAVSKAR